MVERYYQVCSEGEMVFDKLPSLSEAKKKLKELKEFDIIHHISGTHYTIEEISEGGSNIYSNTVFRDCVKVIRYRLTAQDSLTLKKLIKDEGFDEDSEEISEENSEEDSDLDEDDPEEVSENSTITNKTYKEYLEDSLKDLKKTDFRYYYIKILLEDSEAKSWGYLKDLNDLEGNEYDTVSPKNAKKIYKNLSK